MASQTVNIQYFFRNPNGFPWDVLKLSRPYSGPLHSYLCEAAYLFCDIKLRPFLEQRCTMRELERFNDGESGLINDIIQFCKNNPDVTCRFTKERLVIEWLNNQHAFLTFMQKRLDSLYRQGLLSLPEGAQPLKWSKLDEDTKNRRIL